MDISMESLHVDGAKRGARLWRETPTGLRTLTVYRRGGDLCRTEHVLTHPGDVRDWTAFVTTTATGSTAASRPSPTRLDVDGAVREVPADTLPSHAAPVALAGMLAGSGTELEMHVLMEADPARDPIPAHYSVGNPEPVPLPGAAPQELGTVTLYRDGEVAARHWFDSHEVVASDWGDARSYHVTDLAQLVDGLDPEVAAAVREFVA